jgi:hypothetical protein
MDDLYDIIFQSNGEFVKFEFVKPLLSGVTLLKYYIYMLKKEKEKSDTKYCKTNT